MRANDSQRQIFSELEISLLNFIMSYKSHVLTDSRIIMLGSHLCAEPESEAALDTIEGVYNESKNAYQMISQLSG